MVKKTNKGPPEMARLWVWETQSTRKTTGASKQTGETIIRLPALLPQVEDGDGRD
jgi:hypothetical protein